jgi:hypothetical protein
MQYMIDTATDSPQLIYQFGKFLTDFYATTPVAPRCANPEPDFKPSESLPADKFETNAAPMIPPPPGFPLPPSIPAVPVAAVTAIPAATVHVLSTATIAPMIPPPPGVPVAGPEVDSKGVQWAAALHTSTKTKTIDGQWKARKARNSVVPADTMGKTSIQGVPVPPGTESAAIAAYVAGPVPIPPPPMMAPPVTEDDPEVEVENDTVATVDFPTFISNITAGMNAGTVTQKQIDEIQTAHGLQNLFSLSAATPELLSQVSAAFGF